MRDVNAIIAECDYKNKKWKETFAKFKAPVNWGIPIVKSSCEKWDGKLIPSQLLNRYQKFLLSKNLNDSVFLPVNAEISFDLSNSSNDISPQSNNNSFKEELKMETENEKEKFNSLHEICNQNDYAESQKSGVCNEGGARMVLRNRNQNRTLLNEYDDFSLDGSDDCISKQKALKDKKFAKNKRTFGGNNSDVVMKLEKCNINSKNSNKREKNSESIFMVRIF